MKFCNLEYDFKDRVIHRSTIICMLKCTSIYFVTKINPRGMEYLRYYKRIKQNQISCTYNRDVMRINIAS